jgi:hypothetical protein
MRLMWELTPAASGCQPEGRWVNPHVGTHAIA